MTDVPITAPQARAAGLLCPHCRIDLVMADRQGVEIDYCPTCRGVWLDRGELDKIIERCAVYEARPTEQAPGQPAGFLPQAGTPFLPVQPAPPPQDASYPNYPNQGGYYDQGHQGRRDHCDDRDRRGSRGFLGRIFD